MVAGTHGQGGNFVNMYALLVPLFDISVFAEDWNICLRKTSNYQVFIIGSENLFLVSIHYRLVK